MLSELIPLYDVPNTSKGNCSSLAEAQTHVYPLRLIWTNHRGCLDLRGPVHTDWTCEGPACQYSAVAAGLTYACSLPYGRNPCKGQEWNEDEI